MKSWDLDVWKILRFDTGFQSLTELLTFFSFFVQTGLQLIKSACDSDQLCVLVLDLRKQMTNLVIFFFEITHSASDRLQSRIFIRD